MPFSFFLYSFRPLPHISKPLIPHQIHVSRYAKSVIHRSFGIALPVSPLRPAIPNDRSANLNGFGNGLPPVPIGTHPQGDHGIHAGRIINSQMTTESFKMGVVGSGRITRLKAWLLQRLTLGFPFLGGLRVLMVNPSGQRKRLAAFTPFSKKRLYPRDSRHLHAVALAGGPCLATRESALSRSVLWRSSIWASSVFSAGRKVRNFAGPCAFLHSHADRENPDSPAECVYT